MSTSGFATTYARLNAGVHGTQRDNVARSRVQGLSWEAHATRARAQFAHAPGHPPWRICALALAHEHAITPA